MALLWLVLVVGAQQSQAQQLGWEKQLSYTSSDVFGCLHQLTGGDYVVSGIGAPTSSGFSFLYARVQAGGTLVYQRTGRKLGTLEQSMVALTGSNGSSLLAATVQAFTAVGNNGTSRLFFQRIRPNGDTLPGVSYPLSFLEGFPVRAVREGDSVRVLTFAYDSQHVGQYALVNTDTLGTVGRVRRYTPPVFGDAYPCDFVRTARGGWLMVGSLGSPPYFHPYLVETDAQGRLRRQRDPLLFTGSTDERVVRLVNNLVRLRDGSGYVFSGQQKIGAQTYGYLAKLDTALNVVWTYRHPPQATTTLSPRQVYELADGTLVWLAGDGGQATSYLYVIRVSAAGQLIRQQQVSSAGCGRLGPYGWQPLAGGGALVVGGASTCTAMPTVSPAYVARIDNATLLPTTPAASSSETTLYPNPAREAATWQGAVPAGASAAELLLFDVLGRPVRRLPVPGRGDLVSQALDLRGLVLGAYACRLLLAGQPSGPAARLLVLP